MTSLLTNLYPDLLQQAGRLLARYPMHPLQADDLLHIALERILRRPPAEDQQEEPVVFGLVIRVMQRALIDEHRRQNTNRRSGSAGTLSLEHAEQVAAAEHEQWPDVNEALAGLRLEMPEAADIVELRFFHGVPQCEIARRMSLSPATLSRRWQIAAAWLRDALNFSASETRAA